jgi:spore germination protein YaaH
MTIILLYFIGYASALQYVSFGFYPIDTDPKGYQPNWTSLTHVSYLAWIANADGSISDKRQNTSSYVNIIFQDARQHGVKTVIGIGTGNQSAMDNILANHVNDFANNISSKIESTGAEGVILDFEYPQNTNSITGTSNRVLYENMMKTIYSKVKALNTSYYVGFCTPPYFDGYVLTYQNTNLSNYIDSVFIMGYDYNYPQTNTFANSPFYSDSTRHGLRHSIEQQSSIYGKTKLIYGVPFYGYEYTTSSNKAGAAVLSMDDYVYLGDITTSAQIYGEQWDSDSNTPWYHYQVGNIWHQVWYDDNKSLALKYQYIRDQGLQGVGFWALGYEGNNSSIWNVFARQSDN